MVKYDIDNDETILELRKEVFLMFHMLAVSNCITKTKRNYSYKNCSWENSFVKKHFFKDSHNFLS